MKSVMDLFFSLLKFLGLLDEPSLLRKNFKRNRVYDDFSSDDETPVLGYQQVKRFRCSDIIATIDHRDKEGRYNNPVRNVPVQLKGSYTASPPKESPKRMVPVDLPGISRNGLSSPPKETNAAEDFEHEEPKVAWVESKLENTKKKSYILHVDLDDDDSDKSQQGDDVVFVKEVNRPPEHVFATNSHAIGLNDQIISKVLEKIASEENLEYQELLRRIANTIKPMSKEKPIGDGKRAENSASFRLPKTTQINILNEITLDNELNADTYQNAPQEQDPIRVSSTDSSDSDDDVELVPLESSTTSSVRKDSNRNIAELSRNWLLELDSEYNNKLPKNQEKINNARRISDITSEVNSDQTITRPHSDDKTDTTEDRHHHLLLQFDSKYNNKQPHNKSVINNDSRRASVTPNRNNEQNEAGSSSPETINEWLAKLDAKYFSTPLKTPEKLNNEQKHEAQSYKGDIAGAGLLRLESKNKTSLLKSNEKHNDAPQDSKIVSKVNTVQNEGKVDTTREWLAKLKAEYFSTPTKAQENLNRHESNIVPKVNEQNDVRSYLPATSRDWLLGLDAKYNTTPQKNQENFNNARQKLNNVSKVNGEDRSLKLDSTDDWLTELKSRCNSVQPKRQEELNDASRKSVIETELNSNQNKSCSHKPDTARETLSISDSKPKTEQPKMQEKLNDSHQEVSSLSKVNSEQNKARSFKFNSSEDLMLKLGSLYNKYQQETQEKRRKSLLNPDEIKQVNREHKHELRISKTEESDVEMQSNVDLPALTPEQEKLVDAALEPDPEEELLVERFNLRIHRRDLQTLSDLNWLNDEVINFYMNLIMQRSEERKELPKVYATNTFFYPKLMQSGQAGLRRWTRKVDIFACDLFVVPVNIGHHWCLSIVDFRERIIKYMDSRRRPNQECVDALLQYLKDEHQDKKGASFDVSGWNTECVTDIPQQMNGSDCGMFACTFAEFSSRGAAYSFTQAHMPYLRRKAALEILMGKLLL